MKIDIDKTCIHLYTMWNGMPADLKKWTGDHFPQEIYHGANLIQKQERDDAAENVFILSALEAQFLKAKTWVKIRQVLTFQETTEQIMRAMSGALVLSSEIEDTPNKKGEKRVVLTKSDGLTSFKVYATVPEPDIEKGQIRWVAEPFGTNPYTGEMVPLTSVEGTAQAKMDPIRPASAFPKYLRERRCKIEKIEVKDDGRTAWLEYRLEEFEPYKANENFLTDIAEELGIAEPDDETNEKEAPQEENHEPAKDLEGIKVIGEDE